MLEQEIGGNTIENWCISILFILGAIVVVKLLSLLGKKLIKPFVSKTTNRLDDVIYYSLDSPLKFVVILLGIWIAIHRLVYPDSFVTVVDHAYSILIVLDITWVFARMGSGLLQIYWGQKADGHTVITYYYYITKQGDILKVTSDMNIEILASFNKAKLEFAFPTQTLYVRQDGETDVTEGKEN